MVAAVPDSMPHSRKPSGFGMEDIRLLAFDDDTMFCESLVAAAERIGCAYRWATEPSIFFELLRTWQPTHILLDLHMPSMDGVEVMVRLASERCQARLIIVSIMDERVRDAAARSAGEHRLKISGVLAKPFSLGDLRALLQDEHTNPARSWTVHKVTAETYMPSQADLKRAIDEDELFLVYQPKISCDTGELAGFEALVRWRHPVHGIVPPMRFIPIAETSHLIEPLTESVFAQGIRWLSKLLYSPAVHLPPVPRSKLSLAVNLSPKVLGTQRLLHMVSSLCEKLNIPPDRIVLELTETAAMDDPTASLDLLTRFRVKGFHLSIDDFGTGYSSMVQLVRLPFSEIKVDKSFVMKCQKSEEARTVIRSIIDLGRSLNLKTIAEGVEDSESLQYLRSLGCDQAQGFYLAKPMEGDEAIAWAQQWIARLGH